MGLNFRWQLAATTAIIALCAAGCSREDLLGPDDAAAPTTPGRVPNVAALGLSDAEPTTSWTPRVRTLQTATASVHQLYEEPGCESAATVADRLETTWDLWFGRVVRHNQPAYAPLVLDPLARFTVQCGHGYSREIVARLDDPDGDLGAHIDKVAASETEVDVTEPENDTASE